MAKTLKISTIEKRFDKLHNIANFAEDFARAITEHTQLLIHEGQTDAQTDATLYMTELLNNWSEKFALLATEMQRVESFYYATAKDGVAELIAAIPSPASNATENPFKMTELLCKLGYYEIEGDPYETADKLYSDAEIISNIQDMCRSLQLCVKALANAGYEGIWIDAGKLSKEMLITLPIEAINGLFSSYGISVE